jgi:ABC-2 type transport system permease protein
MIILRHSGYLTVHHLRRLWRQPWFVAITLVQPIIWIMIFGQLFSRVIEIPGFRADSYIDFLTPGVVIMTALFSSGWSGMGMIEAIERGVLDRFLVSPARRTALIAGPLLQNSVVIVIQSIIIVLLGLVMGAKFPGGVVGVLVLMLSAVLLGAALSALSHGLALIARKEATLIAAVNLFVTPISFLSPSFMQLDLAADWIQRVARFNPVTWAIEASRAALNAETDWHFVFIRLGMLLVLVVLCAAFATRAFRSYQRSA